ncbi:MAG: DsbA family oxidoreductase [Ktedonobacteraceae bacterium]|nr:DsbA family oxidoreductase [Ktedonobacteraceae bacterium]
MKVEIWSDVVCPWCYIGKRRFEAALARFAHRDDVEITWRSFELDPTAPRRIPGSLNDMIAQKLGKTPDQAAALHAQLTTMAGREGLDYQLDKAQPGNTFDAHRLIHLAATYGLQGTMKERLLKAYFSDGLSIGDPNTLVEIAAEVGLDAQEARAMLDSNDYADDVHADEQRAAAFGIRGVPFVAIDEKYGISGAQPSDLFLEALEQAWAESHPLTMVSAADGTNVCEGDACDLPGQDTN